VPDSRATLRTGRHYGVACGVKGRAGRHCVAWSGEQVDAEGGLGVACKTTGNGGAPRVGCGVVNGCAGRDPGGLDRTHRCVGRHYGAAAGSTVVWVATTDSAAGSTVVWVATTELWPGSAVVLVATPQTLFWRALCGPHVAGSHESGLFWGWLEICSGRTCASCLPRNRSDFSSLRLHATGS
jgi:hypothetical protein